MNFAWLIPAFPFLGFLINGLLGPKLNRKAVEVIGSTVIGLSFATGIYTLLLLLQLPAAERVFTPEYFTWIQVGEFHVSASFLIDPLSTLMVLVVTGVGFLIHIYSAGYMHEDPSYARFFAYLNLFVTAMLILVLGNSLLVMFVGWEGVGLCSYLLIGFWYQKQSASDAGKKAFIVNRIGDFGFLLAIFLAAWTFQTLNFHEMFEQAATHYQTGNLTITAITLLLFLGATGKSAQIPLYVWLPDAMEGPTPVSALIHAATMVTAGVYMIARCSVLFSLSPFSMGVVAIIGCVTAVFAASIGLVQNDIKRVLAYSTVSQLGYMFLACGVGAFTAGIFHLMTHAFFKALLFLGAGSVIHALSGEQDLRKMGGLFKKLPITYWTFIFATLAISGIIPFAGFFSKDEILFESFINGYPVLYLLALGAALLTAFYMFRLVFLTFHGKSRVEPDVASHIHESPWSMAIPLIILAVLSLVGGWIQVPIIHGGKVLGAYLAPVFHEAHAIAGGHGGHPSLWLEGFLMGLSLLIAIGGIAIAYLFYIKDPDRPKGWALYLPSTYKVLLNKYFVDEFYISSVVDPLKRLAYGLWAYIDVKIIDGLVNGAGNLCMSIAAGLRPVQTGRVQHYAISVLLGVCIFFAYILFI
jgi:NADH-quinone oxidoreductase subunit L